MQLSIYNQVTQQVLVSGTVGVDRKYMLKVDNLQLHLYSASSLSFPDI
jgi:hypothetical protein